MKRIFAIIMIFNVMASSSSDAQVLLGGFEEYDGVGCVHPFYGGMDAFRKGCVGTSWKVSHGSPDAFTEGGSDPDYDFDNVSAGLYAGIFNGVNSSEGLYYDGMTFYQYNTYTVSFKIYVNPTGQGSVTTVQNLYFKLANNLTPKTNSTAESVSIPNVSSQEIYSHQNFSNTTPQVITFTFQPQETYNQLWFFIVSSNVFQGNGIYAIVDDVVIDEVVLVGDNGCCTPNLTYSNTNNLPVFSKAFYSIITGENVTVQNGQTRAFQAGSEVIINPGFTVENGGLFLANIFPCTSNITPISADAGPDKIGCYSDVDCQTVIGTAPTPHVTYSWSAPYAGDMAYLNSPNSATSNICAPPLSYDNGRYVPEAGKLLIYTLTTTTCGNTSTDQINVYFAHDMYCNARMGAINMEISRITVYPNPATDVIEVNFNSFAGTDVKCDVYNSLGAAMYSKDFGNLFGGIKILDVSDYPSGVYFIRIVSDEEVFNKEIILSK